MGCVLQQPALGALPGRNHTHTDLLYFHIHGVKLCQGRVRLDVRKRFFPHRVVGHGHRLPKEVVVEPDLRELKEHLENALRHLAGVFCAGSGVGFNDPWGHFQLRIFHDSKHSFTKQKRCRVNNQARVLASLNHTAC